jgi:hypothetical protein
MRIFWDRAGRDSNVGREPRYIYVEWEDPDPYARLLVDITYYVDDFVENVVVPNLFEYLRRVPPLYVRLLGGVGECEFLIVDFSARPFFIITRTPYDFIDYTRYWRRVRYAKLGSYFRNFILQVPEVASAVEINVGGASFLVPREIFERWLAVRAKLESVIQQLEELEVREQRAPKELHVEFE